ncbi:ISL3 family transposase, partial [Thiotrichales bacterium 19X7-9]|nr:ISL3 family transposase [Thiotrichales bacterium 19X7-9]
MPGFKVLKSVCANPLIMHIAKVNKSSCIHCGFKRLRKKDTFIRQLLHETTGLRRCILKIKTHKFQCYRCKRYFNERLPGILKYQRATEKLKEQIYYLHTKGVSSTDLARDNHISNSTVERYFQQIYQRK